MNNNENMPLSELIGRNNEPKTNSSESTRNENFIPVDVESILPSRKPVEAAENGNQYVTNERIVAPVATTYDYDALMAEFQDLVGKIMSSSASNAPKITAIVERYLGKGKKVGDTTPDQAEFIHLIVSDIKADILK